MVSGGGSSSSSSGATGQTSSLSFVPALLANAFFGTGVGLSEGGFTTTGTGDFNRGGRLNIKKSKSASSLIDPFGLQSSLVSPPSTFGGGGDQFSGGGVDFSQFGPDRDTPLGFEQFFSQSGRGLPSNQLGLDSLTGTQGQTGGVLNPFDLVSNLTDLANPNINPAISQALGNLDFSRLSGDAANQLLGGIGSTFQEGLNTGFKPDLQPIIDEATRGFFQDIVPQLGQQNVALQEGVGPFSTDLSNQLLGAGGTLASQLGSLEVQNQNLAADRRGEFLGLSGLITDQLFNAPIDAARNQLNLGEQLAIQGTRGGRQASLLQLLAGQIPSGPIQASSQRGSSKGGQGGVSATAVGGSGD